MNIWPIFLAAMKVYSMMASLDVSEHVEILNGCIKKIYR